MQPTRILITGADGQLGWELARTFAGAGEVVALSRSAMDLSSADAIRARCRDVRPTLILNAGAYTAVDKAEAEPELANRVNAVAPGILAEEANRLGATLIHYSTDYVFDGNAQVPYLEDHATAPQNVYGRTKLAGELAISAQAKSFAIFRTSWLYGNRRHNFMLTMLRLAREREELRVVADQMGSPTWVRFVAEITAQCVSAEHDVGSLRIKSGTYHLTARGSTTWHGFAAAILEATQDNLRCTKRVLAITSGELTQAAKRPNYSVLAVAKLESTLGTAFPDWRAQLAGCVAERTMVNSSTGADFQA